MAEEATKQTTTTEETTTKQTTTDTPWYSGIKNEAVRGVAATFADEKAWFDALGVEPSADDWAGQRAAIKDEKLRDHAGRFASLDDLVKGNMDLRADRDRIKSTAIVPPGKDAKPEEIAAYRKAIGAGEKPEDYAPLFKRPEGEMASDAEVANELTWAQAMADLAVPKATAEALIAKFRADRKAEQDAIVAEDKAFAERTEAILKDKWKGDDFARNNKASENAIVTLADKAGINVEELRHMELKDGRFFLDHPVVRMLFATVGLEMAEGNLGPAVSETERSGMQGRLETIREGIAAAQAKGDHKEADRLYSEEQKLIGRMQGNKPIVGAAGRAA